jgi:hypothetical protein
MARTAPRPPPDREQVLKAVHRPCPACGGRLRYRDDHRHTVTTLTGLVRLHLQIRRCENPACARHHRPYRPEAEGALVLPQHEFGLDVIALIGAWRYREHRSVPEIHRGLRERGVAIAERTVTHLLDRYDELVATTLADHDRLRAVLARQGRVILALDGLQPDVGHEVLWGHLTVCAPAHAWRRSVGRFAFQTRPPRESKIARRSPGRAGSTACLSHGIASWRARIHGYAKPPPTAVVSQLEIPASPDWPQPLDELALALLEQIRSTRCRATQTFSSIFTTVSMPATWKRCW